MEETANRGYTDLVTDPTQQPRLKRWVNQAYREITDTAHWPFLEATKEGVAPLTISDLGHVLSVTNKTSDTTLAFLDRRTAVGFDPALNDTGTAEYWFREGETSLRVYPLDSSSTLVVRYVKVPPELSAEGDVPLIPAAYQDLIVDGATVRALKNRDNYEAAQFVRQEWKSGIALMKQALLKPNYDRERMIVRTGAPGDYLG
jgi:hypothetical protein